MNFSTIAAVSFALASLVLAVSSFLGWRRAARAEEERDIAWGVIDERAEQITDMEHIVDGLQDRNERLHEDLRRMRERLPGLTRAEALAMDAEDLALDLADEPVVDEDPVRAYIPEWERLLVEDPDRFGKTFGSES